MTVYTSDDSYIEKETLRIGEQEVTYTVYVDVDTTYVYIMPASKYADALAKQKLNVDTANVK